MCFVDEVEENALNEKYCNQVLRILNTKADTGIEKLENDHLRLENELACTEHESWLDNWPESWDDYADHTEKQQLLLDSKPAESLHETTKDLREDHLQELV